jgi:nucleotide-binding universal stress UspA family protein
MALRVRSAILVAHDQQGSGEMILIAYDGSEDAKAAVEHAGALMPGETAVLLTVWEPFSQMLARTPAIGVMAGPDEIAETDDAARAGAEDSADEGTALARSCGLDATARIRRREDSIADAILAEADRSNAAAIVIGSRGRGDFGSALLGSVSHALLSHADRPVVIVPSPKVAFRRNERRRHRTATPA